MTAAFQISDSYGVVLTDSGRVLPYGPLGELIEPSDSEGLLQLVLAAAVELRVLREEHSDCQSAHSGAALNRTPEPTSESGDLP